MKLISALLPIIFYFLIFTPTFAVSLQSGLPEGTSVDLTDYFLPNPGKAVRVSSGEMFYIKPGSNNEYIQCTNDPCTNFQKIFITESGFGIQGENHWNGKQDVTFQYRQGTFNPFDTSINFNTYPQATWLARNMKVGEVHDSGPITVIGFYISPNPNEGIIKPCDSFCDNTGAGNGGVSTKLSYVGPVDFGNIKLEDVAIIDVVSGPGTGEKFYFAKDIGWVGWEYNGISNIINQPIDGSIPNPDFTSSPTTSPSPGSSKSKIKAPGREEQKIYDLNSSLLPKTLSSIDKPTDQNIFDQIRNLIGKVFSGIFFNNNIFNEPKLYTQSENIYQSNLPKILNPKNNNPTDQLKSFLGGQGSFYGKDTPNIDGVSDVKSSEQFYEQSNFPKNIRPITGM